MNDKLVNCSLSVLRLKKTKNNYDILFTFYYNFLPAFVFAPYLIFIGISYDLKLLLLIGVVLFLADTAHLIKAIKTIRKS